MLSYRHASHAGNHGDVLKHAILVSVLRHYTADEKEGICYIDTHAGTGVYLLNDENVMRNREFESGVGRVLVACNDHDHGDGDTMMPSAVKDYLELVTQLNKGNGGNVDCHGNNARAALMTPNELRQYPGSPALAQSILRANKDDVNLFEIQPSEFETLLSFVGKDNKSLSSIQVHMSDGFKGLASVLPPDNGPEQRRIIVLIDPPYKEVSDYSRTVEAVQAALIRSSRCTILVWIPQLANMPEAISLPIVLKETVTNVSNTTISWLHASVTVRDVGMKGSSVFIVNPPPMLRKELNEVLPWLAKILAENRSEYFLEESSTNR